MPYKKLEIKQFGMISAIVGELNRQNDNCLLDDPVLINKIITIADFIKKSLDGKEVECSQRNPMKK